MSAAARDVVNEIPIHTWTVKWIHERRCIPNQNKAVPCKSRAVISEIFPPVDIFLVKSRINQNLARDRMLHQKGLEPFAEFSAVLRPIDESLVKNHADTHVTRLSVESTSSTSRRRSHGWWQCYVLRKQRATMTDISRPARGCPSP